MLTTVTEDGSAEYCNAPLSSWRTQAGFVILADAPLVRNGSPEAAVVDVTGRVGKCRVDHRQFPAQIRKQVLKDYHALKSALSQLLQDAV